MAKAKRKDSTAVARAAEAFGRALGSAAGAIDSLQTQHPHPIEEARKAFASGEETLAAVVSKAGTRATAVIKKAKTVTRRAKKAATRVRRKSTPTFARVTGAARKVVKRARKAIRGGRKTVRRSAGRLKR